MKLLASHRDKVIFGIFVAIAVGFVILVSYSVSFNVKKSNNQNVNISNANQSNTNNQIDISGWQTYQNEEMGFEIKYPNDWKVSPMDPELINREQNGAVFSFQSDNQPSIYRLNVTKIDNPLKLTAKELTGQLLKDDSLIRYEGATEDAIGLYNAYILHRVFGIDEYDENAIIVVGNNGYRFIYPSPEDNPNVPDSTALSKIVEKIISTFHFLE